MDKIIKAIKSIVPKDSDRDWMGRIHKQNGAVYATNAIVLAKIKDGTGIELAEGMGYNPYTQDTSKTSGMFCKFDQVIPSMDKLDRCFRINVKECLSKTREWMKIDKYERHKDKYSTYVLVNWDDVHFDVRKLHLVLQTLNKLRVREIDVFMGSKRTPIVFDNDDYSMVLASYLTDEDLKVVQDDCFTSMVQERV